MIVFCPVHGEIEISEYAKKIMVQQDIKTGENKEMVDVLAASIILQTYLDRKK